MADESVVLKPVASQEIASDEVNVIDPGDLPVLWVKHWLEATGEDLDIDLEVSVVSGFNGLARHVQEIGDRCEVLCDLDFPIMPGMFPNDARLYEMRRRMALFTSIVRERGGDVRYITNRVEKGNFWPMALSLIGNERTIREARNMALDLDTDLYCDLDRQNPITNDHFNQFVDLVVAPALRNYGQSKVEKLVFVADVNAFTGGFLRMATFFNEMIAGECNFVRKVVKRLRLLGFDLDNMPMEFILVR